MATPPPPPPFASVDRYRSQEPFAGLSAVAFAVIRRSGGMVSNATYKLMKDALHVDAGAAYPLGLAPCTKLRAFDDSNTQVLTLL